MKSNLLRIVSLAAFVMLVGCETTGSAPYKASEIEKKYYKECAPTPVEPPCGYY